MKARYSLFWYWLSWQVAFVQINERDDRLRQLEDELHATSLELSEKNRQLLTIREEQTAHKASIGCLQDQISEAEAEVRLQQVSVEMVPFCNAVMVSYQATRLEMTLKETRDELELCRQHHSSEIAALEESLAKLDRELEVEREAARQLSCELQAREEHIQLSSSECETAQRQLAIKLEEVNTLEERVRLLVAEVKERENNEQACVNTVMFDLCFIHSHMRGCCVEPVLVIVVLHRYLNWRWISRNTRQTWWSPGQSQKDTHRK